MIHGREADESSIYDQNESNCRNRQFLEFHLRLHGAIELEFLKLLSPMHQQIESKNNITRFILTSVFYLRTINRDQKSAKDRALKSLP